MTRVIAPALVAATMLGAGCAGPERPLFLTQEARLEACAGLIFYSEEDPRARSLRPAVCADLEDAAVKTLFRLLDEELAAQAQDAAHEARSTPSLETLVLNVERTAFRAETDHKALATAANTRPRPLTRFVAPIRYTVFAEGDAEPLAAELETFTARLAALTGVPFERVDSDGDQNVLVVSVSWAGRKTVAEALSNRETALRGLFESWSDSLHNPCLAVPFHDDSGATVAAVVLIAAEAGPHLLRTCVHEETAQIMGLFGDHPDARPSIFNDDQEFNDLTRHDELLLRILYDPRLRIGMTWPEAEPLVRIIAQELLAEG